MRQAGRNMQTAVGAALAAIALAAPAMAQDNRPSLAPDAQLIGMGPISDGTLPNSDLTITRPQDQPDSITLQGSAPAPLDMGAGPGLASDSATLLADRVTLQGERQLTASGGVVIWYRRARLLASQVHYDGINDRVTITGPIHLTEPEKAGSKQEAILIARQGELSADLTEGILRGARLVLAREMQMAAREAIRSDGGRLTTLNNVVASSCRVCAEDRAPLWEIRARSITHDAETGRIYFDRPQLRAWGMPIAVLPYLSAPDPTVQRANGFLRPDIRTTSGLGFGVKIPYFITMGDHADLTLTPYLALNRTRTLDARWRQAFWNGVMEWNGGVSRDDIIEGKTRWYLFGAGQFQVRGGYNLGFQVQRTSDRAYLLDYDITDADRLWSGLTLDRVRRDKLVAARVGRYETLREDEDDDTQPVDVADLIWKRRFQPRIIGGTGGLEWSLHSARRPSSEDGDNGRDMARASMILDWRRSEILAGGLLASFETQLAADFFRIRQDSRYDDWETRLDAAAATELRWPLIRQSGAATDIVEPVIQVIWSPEHNPNRIPNEDSRLIEFDEGNLFSFSRFPGRDAVETGLRANIGIGWTRIDPAGWSIGLTAGRVLRDEEAREFRGYEPLSGRRSDWLVAAHYTGTDGLSIANRALFDDNANLSRNELRLGWVKPDLVLSAGYLWIDADAAEDRDRDVSELTFEGGWQIAEGWWGNADARYDFETGDPQEAGIGLQYRNECLSVDMSLSRRFTSSGDLTESTDFGLSVRLGGFGRPGKSQGKVALRSCVR